MIFLFVSVPFFVFCWFWSLENLRLRAQVKQGQVGGAIAPAATVEAERGYGRSSAPGVTQGREVGGATRIWSMGALCWTS